MKRFDLMNQFEKAIMGNDQFIGIEVEIGGYAANEYIINTRENFESKQEYYRATYDENGVHNFSNMIRIVNCASGKFVDDVFNQLMK